MKCRRADPGGIGPSDGEEVGAKLFGIAVAVMSLRDDRRIDAEGDFKLVEQAQEALFGLLLRAAMT